MKLRLDLLQHLTIEDVMEEALANNHRYEAAPLFSQTGTGSLRSATQEETEAEILRGEALIQLLKDRLRASQNPKD